MLCLSLLSLRLKAAHTQLSRWLLLTVAVVVLERSLSCKCEVSNYMKAQEEWSDA